MQINKYTGRPFSQRFWTILEKRKCLPVWDYYTQFMDLVRKNQCVVLVGETGSGKTTQVEREGGWVGGGVDLNTICSEIFLLFYLEIL